MSRIIDRARTHRERVWAGEPRDVQAALTGNRGTEGTLLFSALYAVDDTKNLYHFLYTFRQALRKNDLDLNTVKAILKSFLDYSIAWMGWLKMSETEGFLKEASADMMGIVSKEEFVGFIEELILYIGRLNHRLDARMPWSELRKTYDSVVQKPTK